eukprot:gene16778-biopygen8281
MHARHVRDDAIPSAGNTLRTAEGDIDASDRPPSFPTTARMSCWIPIGKYNNLAQLCGPKSPSGVRGVRAAQDEEHFDSPGGASAR